MKNILVTGGAGFIGSNFIRYVLEHNNEVKIVNLDALTYAGSLHNLTELPDETRHTFVQGDIRDMNMLNDLLTQYPIDTIIHFAAESHVDRSILGPRDFIETNIVGTFNLLEIAKKYWQNVVGNRFHHISTDEVYGSLSPEAPPFDETTPYDPNSPYSASKAASDHLVRAYYRTYGLPVTISNCSNNYGPYQFPEKLIPLMVLNAIQGKALPVYGDGQQIRDWLYVEDHCAAIWAILEGGRLGETYNIGGNNQPTNLSLVKTICTILDELHPKTAGGSYTYQIQFVPDRPGHDRRYDINSHKIQSELGWRPKQSLSQGLRLTIEWYLTHTDWLAAISKNESFANWISHNYTLRSQSAQKEGE